MQKKKNKVLIISIILCLILLVVIGLLIIFFATDLFKSNQDLFLKYTNIALENSEDSFIGTDITNYLNKKEATTFTNKGTITPNISKTEDQAKYDNVNNFNISYEGEVQNSESKRQEDISFNYSNDSKLEFSFKQIGEKIGLQSDNVNSKYLVSTAKEIPELDKDLGNVIGVLAKFQELKDIEFSWEKIANLRDKYLGVLNSNISEDDFVKVSSQNMNGYQLNLSGEKLKNVTLKLLETLQNDKETLDLITKCLKIESSSNSLTVNDIAKLKEEIENNNEILNKTLKITVYEQKRKLAGIEINLDENILNITKNNPNDNEITYNISYKSSGENPLNILFNLRLGNITSNEGIIEDYEFQIGNNNSTYNYKLNNNINFVETSNIEDFTNENSMILSNYAKEEVTAFAAQVRQRMIDVNKELMERIGLLENENPIFWVFPNFSELLGFEIGKVNLTEEEINEFNQKFELYKSTKLAGVTVRGLLTTIDQNNELQNGEDGNKELLITEINFKGEEYEVNEQTITMLKEEVQTDVNYRVEFEKDSNTGLIYRAVISESVEA